VNSGVSKRADINSNMKLVTCFLELSWQQHMGDFIFGKVKLVASVPKHHDLKACRGWGGKAPHP
jgi:hypothetical protein